MFNDFQKENTVTEFNKDYLDKYYSEGFARCCSLTVIQQYFELFEGCIFNNGIFRAHTYGSCFIWSKWVSIYFRKDINQFCCFGYDWMGRHFAVSTSNETIFMFDPTSMEVFELSQSLEGFLNEDLVLYKVDTLNKSFFDDLIYQYGTYLPSDKCFGFKKPLFLGGEDKISNYEVIDIEVYWELNHQLYSKMKNLPNDTLINKIDIS